MTKLKHNIFHNKGINNPHHKLVEQNIHDIRKSLELKLYTPKQLSWIFDIDISLVSRIKNNKRWFIQI